MKKLILITLILSFLLILSSWGYKGHRAIALIAQNHITTQTKGALTDLLNGESIEDASTWADDIKSNSKYRNTSNWHFLNLPTGLTYKAFTKAVESQKGDNIYVALNRSIHVLTHDDNPIEMRREALKFIIHLVGDAHQPMHVSRAEDKGGNTIQVRFDNKGTNLHSLWDSKLIDYEGLTDLQMSSEYDKALATEIKQWQSDRIMQWLWESYELSSKIYATSPTGSKLGDAFYKSNIKIVRERVKQAGIRLAGLLNELLKDYNASEEVYLSPKAEVSKDGSYATIGGVKAIKIQEAAKFVGSAVVLSDKVYSVRDMGSFVLVNLGADYPNQILTVVLRGESRELKNVLKGEIISVVGTVTDYRGQPQIEVRELKSINILGKSK